MTEAQIRTALLEAIVSVAPEVEPASLRADADLRGQIDIDSYDFLQILVGLHQRLGVDVPETDYDQFRTLDAATRYLAQRLAAGGPDLTQIKAT